MMPNPPNSAADATPDPTAVPTGYIPQARPVAHIADATYLTNVYHVHPMDLLTETRKFCLVDIAAFILWFFLVQLVIGAVARNLLANDPELDERTVGMIFTLISGLIGVGLIWLIVANRGQHMTTVGLCRDRWFFVPAVGIVGAVGGWGITLLTMLTTMLVAPETVKELTQNAERLTEAIPQMSPLAIIGLAVTVAFYEEVIFRGFLLTRLRRVLGSVAGLILTSALFAAMHLPTQNAIACIPLFAMALFWGALALWRRSILPVILAHALFDSAQLMILQHM